MKKRVLVTGGMGYIGSHTVVDLLTNDFDVVIADNLYNSNLKVLEFIYEITGRKPVFYQVDLTDPELTENVFDHEEAFDVVIHFAALKSVGESVEIPLRYFENNLISLLNILHCMEKYKCENIVFSSSATIYGDPDSVPIRETDRKKDALSAYGSTKQMGEEILEKIAKAGKIKAISLRYFNPVGAHSSGLLGEYPSLKPNNLMPIISKVATGEIDQLTIYGNDYDTPDGTCLRDYIHVVDLADAHVKSCRKMLDVSYNADFKEINLGTGIPYSVLDLIKSFEAVNHLKLNYVFGPRRPGDAVALYADPGLANKFLNWKAERNIDDMVRDSWNWEKRIYGMAASADNLVKK
jgi:UDP-glucose 4-epimerase